MALTIHTAQPPKQPINPWLKDALGKLEIMLDLGLSTDEIRREYHIAQTINRNKKETNSL